MKLLVLGTGSMATAHVREFKAVQGVELVACADLDEEAAKAFAKEHGIPNHYAGLDAALTAGGFEAATNVTPDGVHYQTTMQLLQDRIHVFCEKPLATNFGHAAAMTDAANGAGLVNGVNLTYRNVSAIQKAHELVAEGTIGAVRHVEASYLQSWLTQPAWGDWATEPRWLWRLSKAHGSHGALGDVGVHVLDFVTFAAHAPVSEITCQLKTFDKAPDNRIGEYTLDANDSFSITVALANGANGVVHASRFATGHINDLGLKLHGTKGALHVTNEGPLGSLKICQGHDMLTAKWKDVPLEPVATTYARFADAVMNGSQMTPDFEVAAKLQSVIDGAVLSDQSGGKVAID